MQNIYNQAGMSMNEFFVGKALNQLPSYQQWSSLPTVSAPPAPWATAQPAVQTPFFAAAGGYNPFNNNPEYQVKQQLLQSRMASLHQPRQDLLPCAGEPAPKRPQLALKFRIAQIPATELKKSVPDDESSGTEQSWAEALRKAIRRSYDSKQSTQAVL